MKFLDKYELLESLTTGSVETFRGRELSTGRVVLIHVFPGRGSLGGENSTQWAIDCLVRLAPPPVGAVLEGGEHEGFFEAYLVVEYPADPSQVQVWVHAYQVHSQSTHDAIVDEGKGASKKMPPGVPKHVPATVAEATGEFTKIFLRKNGLQSNEQADRAPNNLHAASSSDNCKSQPGPFTMQFPPGFDDKECYDPQSHGPRKIYTEPASSTVEFSNKDLDVLQGGQISQSSPELQDASEKIVLDHQLSAAKAAHLPAELPKTGTGEFTRFFRGPFEGDSVNDTPASNLSTPVSFEPPQKRESEFTKVFGTIPKSSKEPIDTTKTPFDALFNTPPKRIDPPTFRDSVNARLDSSGSDFRLKSDEARLGEIRWDNPEARKPDVESGSLRMGPLLPGSESSMESSTVTPTNAGKWNSNSHTSGATNVFRPSGSEPPSPVLPATSGPSEYTRVISGGMSNPVAPPEPATSQPMSPPASLPGFSLSSPVVPKPQIYGAQLPPVQFSHPVPPRDKLAGLPGKSRTIVSYWPIIVAMNVLFVLAVALVLYFALKR